MAAPGRVCLTVPCGCIIGLRVNTWLNKSMLLDVTHQSSYSTWEYFNFMNLSGLGEIAIIVGVQRCFNF